MYGRFGDDSGFGGKTHSDETIKLMSESAHKRNKIKLKCPHCGTKMDRSNYAKWHGDNCKKK